MEDTIKCQYFTPKMKPSECIRFYQNVPQPEITSQYKNREQGRSQPVRISQLVNPKPTAFATRKKALPVRMPTPFSMKKKVGLTQNDNVENKLQLRKSVMTHLPSNIKNARKTELHSNCNEEFVISCSNICSQKVQRKTYLNLVPSEKVIKEDISLMCPNIQEEKKPIYSNSTRGNNSKSFVLPPNAIKTMYLKKHNMLSTISKQNDKVIKSLDKPKISKSLHIQDCNIQSDTVKNTHCKSQTGINLHAKKHTTLLNDKEQEYKYNNSYQSNSLMGINAGNLKDICHELKNVILTEKSNLPIDKNTVNVSEDHLCIDKNTILSLKYYLEDLSDVFHNNASKVDTLLTHIKEILHTNGNSIEGNVHNINSNSEIIKNTLQAYQEDKVDKNNMNTSISKLEEDNNVKKKTSVELSEEEKENKIPPKIIM